MKTTLVAAALVAFAAGAHPLSPPVAAPPAVVSAAVQPVRSERHVPFDVGESLTYDVSWSSYVTAGTAVTTVKEKTSSAGGPVYHIVADGRTTGLAQALYTLHYTMETWLDRVTLLPRRASTSSDEGRRHRVRTATFDRGAKRAHYEIQTTTTVKEDVAIAPDEQDALSAIYVLRTIALQPGAAVTMPVTDAGTTYRARFEAGGVERVRAPIGEISARKITASIADANGRPVGHNVAIWIADNAQRWPVKLEAELVVGSFTLALREAR
jgi:hypothetical protein